MNASFLRLAPLTLALLLGARAAALAADAPLYLGVLEPVQTDVEGQKHPTAYMARAAFVREGGEWRPMPIGAEDLAGQLRLADRYPASLHWTAAFDGKARGDFDSVRPAQWGYYAHTGLYQPDPTRPIAPAQDGAKDFFYWEGPSPFRPLVLVSSANVADPDGWKPWKPTGAEQAKYYSAFRLAVGTVAFTCGGEGVATYPDRKIVVDKAYRSRAGTRLIGLRIDPHATKCDEMPEENWSNQWFLDDGKTVRFVSSSLALIDAGDYDGDGGSEVVFLKTGYDYDAYILLYARLAKQAEFGWTYH